MDPNLGDLQCEVEKDLCFTDLETLMEQGKDGEVITILNGRPSLMSIVDVKGQTLLHVASFFKNVAIMEYLIKGGCDIEAKTNIGWTPLMVAANSWREKENPRAVETLLIYNADIFATDLDGYSALYFYLISLRCRRTPVIEAVFEKVKSKSKDWKEFLDIFLKARCCLQDLFHVQNIEVIKMYLDKETFSENIGFDADGSSALFACLEYNYEENLRVLLQYSVFATYRRSQFISYFEYIVSRSETYERWLNIIEMCARLLIELKFLDEDDGARSVDQMFLKSNEKALRKLLKTNLNSFVKNKFGYEPIAYVFGNSNPGIFNLIQQEKFDVNLRGGRGETVLHIAFTNKVEEHVNYLLEKNLDPNMTDGFGEAPILSTFTGEVYPNSNACVKLMLKYNTDIQVCNCDGETFIKDAELTFENEETFKTMVAHLVMLESCGVPIKAEFIDFITQNENLAKFYKLMHQQLQQMKTHIIDRSLTRFATLTRSYDFVSHRVRTIHPDNMQRLCSSADNNLTEYDSYYRDIIRDRIKVAYKIYKTRDNAAAVICDSIDQLEGNLLLVDKICSFISYEYLHKILYPSHDEMDCQECQFPNLTCYQFVK